MDFNVSCPQAGQYTLAFRYAAGAGNASRLIYINGSNTFPNQTFTNTEAWTSYNTLVLSANLAAGPNVISIIFNGSLGSANYLNLDNLVVTAVPPEQIRVTAITVSSVGKVHLRWTTVVGHVYQLQITSSPGGGVWTDLGTPVVALGTSASADDTVGGNQQRFYRVVRE